MGQNRRPGPLRKRLGEPDVVAVMMRDDNGLDRGAIRDPLVEHRHEARLLVGVWSRGLDHHQLPASNDGRVGCGCRREGRSA